MIGHTNICIWSLYLKYLVCLVLWYIYNLVIYCVVFFNQAEGLKPKGKVSGCKPPFLASKCSSGLGRGEAQLVIPQIIL